MIEEKLDSFSSNEKDVIKIHKIELTLDSIIKKIERELE